jgi:hypothetical protein
LVTVLTAVMILGVVAIVGLLVIRLQAPVTATLPLPGTIALPQGVTALSFTQARDWYAVVTDTDEILIFDRATGAMRQRVVITPAE